MNCEYELCQEMVFRRSLLFAKCSLRDATVSHHAVCYYYTITVITCSQSARVCRCVNRYSHAIKLHFASILDTYWQLHRSVTKHHGTAADPGASDEVQQTAKARGLRSNQRRHSRTEGWGSSVPNHLAASKPDRCACNTRSASDWPAPHSSHCRL